MNKTGMAARTLVLALATYCMMSVTAGLGQEKIRNFTFRSDGCPKTQPLDFQELLKATKQVGGKVVVRAVIGEDGSVTSAHYLFEADRSGPEAFWHAVEKAIATWCFSSGAVVDNGYLDYLIVVHPAREGGGGYIEIDAQKLSLKPGWKLDVDRPADLVRVRNLDEGNIVLTEVPPKFAKGGAIGFWAGVMKIWHQLGYSFQFIFAGLFLALMAAIAGVSISGAKPWVRPSLRERLARRGGGVPLDRKAWRSDLGSKDAKEVRELWTEAIFRSQLKEEALPPVDNEVIRKLEGLVQAVGESKDAEELAAKAEAQDVLGEGKILSREDFWKDSLGRSPESEFGSMSLEEAKDQAYQLLEERFGRAGLVKIGQKLDVCKTVQDVEEVLSAEGVSLKRALRAASQSTNWLDIQNAKRIVRERLEWARLYARFREKGWPGLQADELDRLRRLTWEHWCRKLVEAALEKARVLADKGIDLFEVYTAGLSNHLVNRNEWWSSQEIDRSVDRALGEKLAARRSTLDALWAIGAIAPLFGLFGTVWGISRAFGKIQNIEEAQLRMAKLAGDINVALSTTIVGLIIGIASFVTYYLFKDRIEKEAAKVSKYFTDITNLI